MSIPESLANLPGFLRGLSLAELTVMLDAIAGELERRSWHGGPAVRAAVRELIDYRDELRHAGRERDAWLHRPHAPRAEQQPPLDFAADG